MCPNEHNLKRNGEKKVGTVTANNRARKLQRVRILLRWNLSQGMKDAYEVIDAFKVVGANEEAKQGKEEKTFHTTKTETGKKNWHWWKVIIKL